MSTEAAQVKEVVNNAIDNSAVDLNPPTPAPEPTPTPEPTPAPEPTPTPEPAPTPGEGDPPAPAAFEPNYNYVVKGEEKQFDEWARPLIKDAESEKQFREIHEKVYGIDHIKEDRDRFRNDHTVLNEKYGKLDTALSKLSHYVSEDNLDAFFKQLKIPEEQVMRYAQKRLEYQGMDPAQRQEYDQRSYGQTQNYDLQQQNEQLRNDNYQNLLQQRESEVESELNQPEVAGLANAYDERVGNIGAFRDEVFKRGRYYASVEGRNISAREAVDEVLGMVGRSEPPTDPPADPTNVEVANPGGAVILDKPVIPKITGSGASPTRMVPKSIADIRKIRQEKFGN